MSAPTDTVTLVMPARDRANLIGRSIQSVCAQTHPDWELVVVDDSSRDDTAAVVERFARDDGRIRLVPTALSLGAGACRNLGVRESEGAHLLFLDSDDLLEPTCLAGRMAALARHPDIDFGVFRTRMFSNRAGDTDLLWNADTGEPDLERFLSLDTPWLGSSTLWRRDAFLRYGPWPEDRLSWMDWQLHVLALIRGARYRRFDAVDFHYRETAPGTLRAVMFSSAHRRSHVEALGVVADALEEADAFSEPLRTRLVALYYWFAVDRRRRGEYDEARAIWDACCRRGLVEGRWGRRAAIYLAKEERTLRYRTSRYWVRKHWPEAYRFHGSKTMCATRIEPVTATAGGD